MQNVGPAAGVSVGDAKSNICCSQGPNVSEAFCSTACSPAADGIIINGPTYQAALSSAN